MMNKNYTPGLTVQDGRLINHRPDGETGIAMAARVRQNRKHQYKVECIADGIQLAEMRKPL